MRRAGNVVYARTLRRGEEDTGKAVHLEPGDSACQKSACRRACNRLGGHVIYPTELETTRVLEPDRVRWVPTGSQYRLDMASVCDGETGILPLFLLPCSADGCRSFTVGVGH